MPIRKVYQPKMSIPHLFGFVSGSNILFREEQDFPKERTNEGFDPTAYKLMEKAGYDFNNPFLLGKLVEPETYDLNKTQKTIQRKRGLVEVSKVGLGYTPPQLVKISWRCKHKQYVVQHIYLG